MKSFKKIQIITIVCDWFTGISRLLEETMNNTDFAQELHTKRIASGLSQGQLASLIHLPRHCINRFENGKANASEKAKNVIFRCRTCLTDTEQRFSYRRKQAMPIGRRKQTRKQAYYEWQPYSD